ncbi:hypothetical protein GYMLUDRAFT_235325 [Collybiopsis luxurians FD-317 M1]|nr:hypothetical protein GYMLUDRAFT_235325 [Collybiopsis luxurians FD-317 M1]
MSKPWYRDIQQPHHFILKHKIKPGGDRIRALAPFPDEWANGAAYWNVWNRTSALFDPSLPMHNDLFNAEKWKDMIEKFKNALIVAEEQRIDIVWPFSPESRPVVIELSEVSSTKSQKLATDKINVAWALSLDNPYEPLGLFTVNRLVYIFNICTQTLVGCLRGHGGEITSIVVHPSAPHIFITTSRDFTSRIYDLTRTPSLRPNNPPWPLMTTPSLAGPTFALDTSVGEGVGIGRCVVILVGGRSAGHQAEVFNASFKADHPVVATSNFQAEWMDRAIKIWHIPYFSPGKLIREDKPLFSTTMIHKAMVLSVHWLENNILLTHSAPAKMLKDVDIDSDSQESREYDLDEPGSLTVWKWLSTDKFFPPGWNRAASRQQILRGFGSDYQQSASFRILSSYFFPPQRNYYETPILRVCRARNRGPFVIFHFPKSRSLTILNITLFERRLPPPPPSSQVHSSLPIGLEQVTAALQYMMNTENQLKGWDITLQQDEECLETCVMVGKGKVIIAGGSKGSLFLFAEKRLSSQD